MDRRWLEINDAVAGVVQCVKALYKDDLFDCMKAMDLNDVPDVEKVDAQWTLIAHAVVMAFLRHPGGFAAFDRYLEFEAFERHLDHNAPNKANYAHAFGFYLWRTASRSGEGFHFGSQVLTHGGQRLDELCNQVVRENPCLQKAEHLSGHLDDGTLSLDGPMPDIFQPEIALFDAVRAASFPMAVKPFFESGGLTLWDFEEIAKRCFDPASKGIEETDRLWVTFASKVEGRDPVLARVEAVKVLIQKEMVPEDFLWGLLIEMWTPQDIARLRESLAPTPRPQRSNP